MVRFEDQTYHCEVCPAGRASPSNGSRCVLCESGRSAVAGSQECQADDHKFHTFDVCQRILQRK